MDNVSQWTDTEYSQRKRGTTYEDEQQTRSYRRSPNNRHDPMRLRLRTPPVHEEPGRDQGAAQHHDGKPVLRLALPALGGHFCDLPVAGVAYHDCGADHADAHA